MDRSDGIALEKSQIIIGILCITAVLALPAINPQLAWLQTFIPLPVFYFFTLLGEKKGTKIISSGIIISAVLALFSGSFLVLLSSFTFLPAGFVIASAIKQKTNPVKAGTKAVLVTIVCVFFLGVFTASMEQTNPYLEARESFSSSLEAASELYFEDAEKSGISATSLDELQRFFKELKHYALKIFPALLLIVVCYSMWLNLIIGHWLLKKKNLSPWKDYKEWKLPEHLVWGLIVAAIGLLAPSGNINTISLNAVLVLATVYFFQGLAVLSCLLARWLVPQMLKVIIYLLVFIQPYGIILMAVLGIVDIWANLRKQNHNMA